MKKIKSWSFIQNMAKKNFVFLIIIFLIVFGFLVFLKIGKVEAQALPDKVFLDAMKTGTNGSFYVPHISAPMNPKWVRVMPLSTPNPNHVGDQTGTTNEYFNFVPDGTCDLRDVRIVARASGSSEGDPTWNYLADIVPDGKIDANDTNAVSNCASSTGDYVTDLSNVTIAFNVGGESAVDPVTGFSSIPDGATSFTVKKAGNPIGAYVYFYAPRPDLIGYAWAENIGWISVNSLNCNTDGDGKYEGASEDIQPVPADCPTSGTSGRVYNYGVYLDPIPNGNGQQFFHGYAWSPTIGWIKFDPSPPYLSGTNCGSGPSYLLNGLNTWGLVRACAAAPNPNSCDGAGGNSTAGGWDGWICLADEISSVYQVKLDSSTPKEFYNWAWGGGGNDTTDEAKRQSAVVGWISFNKSNCANNSNCTCPSLGGAACPNPSYPCNDPCADLKDYKVTYQPENSAPTVSNAQITGTDYCTGTGDSNGIQKGQVSFSWSYTDFEGDDQERYWLQIATDSSFTNKVIDCQVPNSKVVDPNVAKTMTSAVSVVSSTSTEYNNRCNDGLDLGSRILAISYNGTYYWRVKSKAASGNTNWSDPPAVGPSFTTKAHAYPWSDFSWDPLYPAVFQNVTFDAQPGTLTRFYDATCAADPTNASCSYSWTFTNANVNPNPPPPPKYQEDAQFQTAGAKPVTLQVNDSSGFSCPATLPVQVGLPLPQWKEIPPTF